MRDPDDAIVWQAWPRCPQCDQRRQTKCPICGVAGADFPLADIIPEMAAQHTSTGEPLDDQLTVLGDEVLLMCETCDEAFSPRFYEQCEACGHGFVGGIKEADVERADMTSRAFVVSVALALLALGMLIYFWWIFRQ